jgi:hypothetical protein
MRALQLVSLSFVLTGCSVGLEGATCGDDTNCPNDQRCEPSTQRCVACVSDRDCTDVGATCSGDGTALLSCVRNSGSCLYSTRTACAAGCDSSSKKCNCPANSGPDYYADSVASGTSAFFNTPTGVSDPPNCRFKTITEALAKANAYSGSGARAIATGGSDQSPMLFSANETFPLEVKPGATLTTSDATPIPARYEIEVAEAGASRPVVQLDQDAAVAGFTIRTAGSGSASEAVLVSCAAAGATGVSVTGMVLDGKGAINNGLRTQGPCGIAASNLNVTQMVGSGVSLRPEATASVSLQGSSIYGNGDTGLLVLLDLATGPTISLKGNDIRSNQATTVRTIAGTNRTVGGLLLSGAAPTSLSFASNKMRGNKGDQVMVSGTSGTWNLSGGASVADCGTTANTISCYDTGSVGLSTNGSVSAVYNSWQYDPPTVASNDYLALGTGSVAASPSCSAVTPSCP